MSALCRWCGCPKEAHKVNVSDAPGQCRMVDCTCLQFDGAPSKHPHVDCPCWTTGEYRWTEGCKHHPVEHPHHFSMETLMAISSRRTLATQCGEMANELRLLKLALERGDANPKVVADVAELLRRVADNLDEWRQHARR